MYSNIMYSLVQEPDNLPDITGLLHESSGVDVLVLHLNIVVGATRIVASYIRMTALYDSI